MAGSIYDDYDPQGALGGLFAPAFIKGFAPSEAAVSKWQAANHALTPGMLDQTAMPAQWTPPAAPVAGSTFRQDGGSGISSNLNFGGNKPPVDPEALRVLAQGGKYDMAARRDAITQRILENAAAQSAAQTAAATSATPATAFTQGQRDPYGNYPAVA
jgi:hypothetical protein